MDGQPTRPLVYAGSYTACCEGGGPWRGLSTTVSYPALHESARSDSPLCNPAISDSSKLPDPALLILR
jgi:hypothetical protein